MALSEEQKITAELMKQARMRQEFSSSIERYNKGVDDLKVKQKTLVELEKLYVKLQKEGTAEATKKAAILAKQMLKIQREHEELRDVLKEINAGQMALAKTSADAIKSIGKGLAGLDGTIKNLYGRLKNSGLIDMEKAIKTSALQMGVLHKESIGYRTSIIKAAKVTSKIGVGIKELTEMQTSYSDELGRNVLLSQQGYEAMSQMSVATGLGAEGAAKMAAEMETVGFSVEKVGDFINESLKKSHKMGLNASKTVKNLTSGLKLMNKFSFKEGVAGLDKMAKTVSKLGVSMEFAAGMSEKLWNIEGAVEMSAQLQVMGGEWAKLADPFKLMYMARNDMAALTEQLGKAAESSVEFNERTKEFDVRAGEMHRLKIIAEQTGVSLEELVTAGKNAAKYTKIKSQISFSVGGGKEGEEMKEFLTNKSFLDKNGKATIIVGGEKKLLSELGGAGKNTIKALMEENQNMQERAEDARTFDEAFTNMINGMKISLLPFIKTLNDKLIPKIDNLVKRFYAEKWADKLENIAKKVGDFVSTIGGWMLDNPLKTLAVIGTAKIGGFLFEKASWIANGIALATGFKLGNPIGGVPGGLGAGAASPTGLGGAATMAKTAAKSGAAIGAGIIAGVTSSIVEWQENSNKNMSTSENVGRTAMRGGGAAAGGWAGAVAGATAMGATGAALGTVVPGLGNLIGGAGGVLIGGALGAMGGGYAGDWLGNKAGDLTYGQPINDGIVSNGKITPIDSKDDLLAMKKGGAIDRVIDKTSNNDMTITIPEITINGKIEIVSPGSPGLSIDLMKDPQFRRDISRVVTSEIEKNKNFGKNKG